MRKYLLAVSVLLMFQFAYGKEYGNYEPKRILQLSETPSGKSASIDFGYFDKMLSDLSIHAKNYPPQFDTIQDKNRAVRDVTMLSGLLDILLTTGISGNPEFLVRAGYLNSIGHNLDISGSAQKADSFFQKLLRMVPADPRGNYMYGSFLAGVGKPKEALPYLEKARSVGVTDAEYAIGMTHLTLGDKDKALENLEAYKRRNPNDENVDKLIDAIRNGKIEFKRNPG